MNGRLAEMHKAVTERLAARGTAARTFRLTLPGAVYGKDLHLVLFCDGATWLHGRAWIPGFSRMIHPVEADAVKISGPADTPDFNFALRCTILPDAALPAEQEPAAVTLSVKGESGKDKAWGSYSGRLQDADIRGAMGGKIVRVRPDLPFADTFPSTPVDTLGAYELYSAAVASELECWRLYRVLRALAVMDSSAGMAYSNAFRLAFSPLPWRPSFDVAARVRLGAPVGGRAPAPRKKPPKDPGADIPDLDDAGAGEPAPAAAAPSGPAATAAPRDIRNDPLAQSRLATLRGAHECLDRLLAAVGAHTQAGARQPDFVRTIPDTGDPLFGPWFGNDPLPSIGATNVLSAEFGADGPQNWAYLQHWRIAGPVPLENRSFLLPLLPDAIGDDDQRYNLYATWSAVGQSYNGSPTGSYNTALSQPGTGRTAILGKEERPNSSLFAFTELVSDSDRTVWMAGGANDCMQTWINDRLVAVSPPPDPRDPTERIGWFQAPLRKGLNRVAVRWDNSRNSSHFWLRVCTRGRPDAAATRAHLDSVAKRRAAMDAAPRKVLSFRNGGTALFPDAKPVTAWDWKAGINVLWKTPMPRFAKAQAIVVGDKVFTMSEPHFLLCLDKMNGKILWTREANVLEAVSPSAYEKSKAMWTDYEQTKDWRKYGQWYSHLLRESGAPPLMCWDGSPSGPWVGYAMATPVSDGKRIWITPGIGATACYDLDGNRIWMVQTKRTAGNTELCSSAILTGDPDAGTGRLVLKVSATAGTNDEDDVSGTLNAGDTMIAYEALSGKEVWRASTPVPESSTSLHSMMLTDGKEDVEVVVHGCGTVVRAVDGKVLVPQSYGFGGGMFTAVGDVLYRWGWKYGDGTATRLLMLNRDLVGTRRDWTAPCDGTGCAAGWAWGGDGFLYSLRGSQFGGPYAVLDVAKGQLIERRVNIGERDGVWNTPEGTDSYVPTTVAGDFVFCPTRGTRSHSPKADYTYITVAQRHPQGRFIAHNKFETKLQAPPVFDGDRWYIRTDTHLYCMAYTGDEGRALEAEVNARALFNDLSPDPPSKAVPAVVKPLSGVHPPIAIRFSDLPLTSGGQWAYLGPFAATAADAALAQLGGPEKALPKPGQTITVDGKSYAVRFPTRTEPIAANTNWLSKGPAMALKSLLGDEAGVVGYFFSALSCPAANTVRVILPTPGASIWISGVPVNNGDRVTVAPGAIPIVVKVVRQPGGEEPFLLLQFLDSSDIEAEIRLWRESLAISKPIFERIAKYRPDSDLAAKARKCLAHLP